MAPPRPAPPGPPLPTKAVLEAWLLKLWAVGRLHGYELDLPYTLLLGDEAGHTQAHRAIEKLIEWNWIEQQGGPAPVAQQLDQLGPAVLELYRLEAERDSYPDRTVFWFAPRRAHETYLRFVQARMPARPAPTRPRGP